jgi:hypothetical protein
MEKMIKIVLKEKQVKPYVPATFDPNAVSRAQNRNLPTVTLRTYADLKAALDGIAAGKNFQMVTDTGKVVAKDAIINMIAGGAASAVGIAAATATGGASLAVSAGVTGTIAVLQKLLSKKDSVKTDTFLDKLDVDDKYSALVSNEAEIEFLKTIYQFITEKAKANVQLPPNFNMNREFETWIKTKYQRDLRGAP